MSNYKGLLFDLDGTLVDSWPALHHAILETCKDFARPVVDNIDYLKTEAGSGLINLMRYFFPKSQEEQYEKTVLYARKIYQQSQAKKVSLLPQIKEIIRYCDDSRIPWGIVTNKPRYLSHELLEQQPEFKNCAAIVCPEDVGAPKPAPASLLLGCELLDLSPDQVLYVGDSSVDQVAAKGAGIDCLLCLYSYEKADSLLSLLPKYTASNPENLSQKLKNLTIQ